MVLTSTRSLTYPDNAAMDGTGPLPCSNLIINDVTQIWPLMRNWQKQRIEVQYTLEAPSGIENIQLGGHIKEEWLQ
jgi:hypothetical protein